MASFVFYVKIALAKYHAHFNLTVDNLSTYCISYAVETYYSNEVIHLQMITTKSTEQHLKPYSWHN